MKNVNTMEATDDFSEPFDDKIRNDDYLEADELNTKLARSSTPVLMELLDKAEYGRDDGHDADSEYGTATVWDNFGLCYRVVPVSEEKPELCEPYERYLERKQEKKKTFEGLTLLVKALRNELQYNENVVNAYKANVNMAYDKYRNNPWSDVSKEAVKVALFHNFLNEENVRKVRKELEQVKHHLMVLYETDEAMEELETKHLLASVKRKLDN